MAQRFYHLSDPHLGPLPPLLFSDWNAKRLLGWLNWQLKRRFRHRPEVVVRLLDDIRALGFGRADISSASASLQTTGQMLLIGGDLTNLGLPAEFENSAQWLRAIGPAEAVAVVPGNHDIYTPMPPGRGVLRWGEYLAAGPQGSDFPVVRRIGETAVIALNSGVCRPPGIASGLIGPVQLGRLDDELQRLGREGIFRLVMVHHPPLPGQASARRGLEDADDLRDVLAAQGAELVVHGHNHRLMETTCDGPDGPFPVIGVPSASIAHARGHDDLASYHRFDVARSEHGWSMTFERRGLAVADGPVVSLGQRQILVGRAPGPASTVAVAAAPPGQHEQS